MSAPNLPQWPAVVSDSLDLRCLACALGRHQQCRGFPCECPPHIPAPRTRAPWPPQRHGDPFQLPYSPRAAEAVVPAPRDPVPPVEPPPDSPRVEREPRGETR